MVDESSIFGLRFGSNASLEPARDDLAHFLLQPRKPGTRQTHAADLAAFRELIKGVAAYDRDSQENTTALGLKDRMFYSVLSYSSLFSPALLSAIELYKYYLNQFRNLDFRKAESFIKAAEQEIAGLNPRKSADAEKIARFQELIRERKNTIKLLEKTRTELIRELRNITKYVRHNISLISGRCMKAIVFLVQLQTEGSEERRLIEDIKNRFRQDLKDGLQRGDVTRADVEAAQQDIAVLSKEITALMREDVFALSSLYEAIAEHARTVSGRLEALLGELDLAKEIGLDAERDLFSRIEESLVSLIADLKLSFKPVEPSWKTSHGPLLEQKREEMLASFREHVRRERRTTSSDRRSGRDRRKKNGHSYTGQDRRSGKERRTGRNRRQQR